MEPKVSSLEIQQFRAIRRLSIETLGRVNLITGRNNTGKSSVLEALRILVSNAAWTVISDILHFREEEAGDTEDEAGLYDNEGVFPLSSLFRGFPDLSKDLQPVVIASRGRQHGRRLTLNAGWFSQIRGPDGTPRYIPQEQQSIGVVDVLPALVVEANSQSRIFPFDILRTYLTYRRARRPDVFDDRPLPCTFVSPYGGERTEALGPLWDRIALSDYEEHVVEALRIIHPEISAVSMVGGERARGPRIAIVRTSTGGPRPVPLRSFGDGLNRLFAIVLSLVNAKGGLLLIDEFENGMHYTVQTDVWRTIFKLASRLDVQVVATSHSWDAVEAFQKAASEDAEEGVLIRLSRKGDDIIPTLFREDELAIVTRDRIEVR